MFEEFELQFIQFLHGISMQYLIQSLLIHPGYTLQLQARHPVCQWNFASIKTIVAIANPANQWLITVISSGSQQKHSCSNQQSSRQTEGTYLASLRAYRLTMMNDLELQSLSKDSC